MIFPQSILRKSGQWWKFILSVTLTLFGGLIMLYGLAGARGASPEILLKAILGGSGLALLGFTFGCIAIRCNKCGTRIFWHAVYRQKSQSWLMWLLRTSDCPNCTRISGESAT